MQPITTHYDPVQPKRRLGKPCQRIPFALTTSVPENQSCTQVRLRVNRITKNPVPKVVAQQAIHIPVRHRERMPEIRFPCRSVTLILATRLPKVACQHDACIKPVYNHQSVKYKIAAIMMMSAREGLTAESTESKYTTPAINGPAMRPKSSSQAVNRIETRA